MTPCTFCGKPATIHSTSLLGKKKVEHHLCEGCAKDHGVVSAPADPATAAVGGGPTLNLQAMVAFIMSQQPQGGEPAVTQCPQCGLKYAQFRAEGRLGCAGEYDFFAEQLRPVLKKAHRDMMHTGKVPRSRRGAAHRHQLQGQLERAVAEERYEDAAKLRDALAPPNEGSPG